MDLLVERVDVWAATIPDSPGGLADVLTALREAGADLRSIVARRALADGGINLRGFSAAVIGTQFVAYVAVDSLDDANKAMEVLAKA